MFNPLQKIHAQDTRLPVCPRERAPKKQSFSSHNEQNTLFIGQLNHSQKTNRTSADYGEAIIRRAQKTTREQRKKAPLSVAILGFISLQRKTHKRKQTHAPCHPKRLETSQASKCSL